jgi:hypothetical protein
MIQNALVPLLMGPGRLDHDTLMVPKKPVSTTADLSALVDLGVTGRICLDVLSLQEIALFRCLMIGWVFLVSVEVCPN